MLGAAAMIKAHPGHALSRTILTRYGEELITLLDEARRPEWEWFEIVLAYDNARLPEALLRAGEALHRQDFLQIGLETLDWIVGRQTSPEGRFRAVGSESFGRPYAEPLPVRSAAARGAGHGRRMRSGVSGDRRPTLVRRGDARLSLVSRRERPRIAACHRGGWRLLRRADADGTLNRNQGAESILALQLALRHFGTINPRGGHGREAQRRLIYIKGLNGPTSGEADARRL
jgi:hypothetical protein